MAEWVIQPLDANHDRSDFRCGQPSLDDFLRQYAGQYARKDVARTYVAVVPGQTKVDGYFSLAAGAVAPENFPPNVAKKLPHHDVPVVHLGRLAVDERARGKGLGGQLLRDALTRALQVSQAMGVFAVEVFAFDESARAFYAKYGFRPLRDDELHLYLPLKEVRAMFPPETDSSTG